MENVDSEKIIEETKVVIKSPKDSPIWKTPQQKKENNAQTLIVDKAQSITDFCSETSDIDHIFDDFDTCSIKSGNGSESHLSLMLFFLLKSFDFHQNSIENLKEKEVK